MSAKSPGRLQRKRRADIARNARSQDLSHEEAVGPQPAKKCKPLSPIKKLTSEPPALSCDTNALNSKREPNLSQETIVSPPTHAVLHTSASPSSLASPLLEPSSSQHLTVRWGPVSPAFLIKDSRSGSSPPLRGHHRAPPPMGPAQQGRRTRRRPEQTAKLLETLTALIRSESTGGTGVTEEGKSLPSVSNKEGDDGMEDEDFHLGGFEDDSKVLADLLNVSSTSLEDLHQPRLKEESDGKHTQVVAATRDVSPCKTSSTHTQPSSPYPEHTGVEDSLEATEHEFWAVADDFLATQEESELCSSSLQSHPPSSRFETEEPFDVSQDEFDLLLSQADEKNLKSCEKETPQRPAQPSRFVRL